MKIETKKEYLAYFKAFVLPYIKTEYESDGRIDYPARREAWNNDIDGLVRERVLPEKAMNWNCPW